jgi:hypothetical protein
MTRRGFGFIAVTLLIAGCAPAVGPPPSAGTAAPVSVREAVTRPCVGEPDAPVAIPWEDAASMIENGRVRAIYQSHCLEVRLDTVDGESYSTIEPALDDVFHIADGAPNGDQIIRASD